MKLSYSGVFPTPTAVPQQAAALPTEMDSMRLAMMRQIKQERDVQTDDMVGIETRLEDAKQLGPQVSHQTYTTRLYS